MNNNLKASIFVFSTFMVLVLLMATLRTKSSLKANVERYLNNTTLSGVR